MFLEEILFYTAYDNEIIDCHPHCNVHCQYSTCKDAIIVAIIQSQCLIFRPGPGGPHGLLEFVVTLHLSSTSIHD